MRDAVFALVMLGLVPMAAARPFAGVLLWSWISFMNPHRLVWGFASGLPWAAGVFAATVVGCLMAGEPKRPVLNAVTTLLVLFLVCVTVTSLAALGPAPVVWDKWNRLLKVVIGLLLTAALLTDRWRLHALVWIMVISIGYYGVKGGLFTILTGGAHRVLGPPQTMIEDNNHLAAAMLVSLPLMHYLRLQSRHRVVRWGLAAAMVLTMLSAIGSYSRGALLGLAASALFMWFRSRQKIGAAVVLGVCLAGAVSFMPDGWMNRMNTIQTYEEDGSAMSRLAVWEVSFKLALDRPFFGSGFGGPYAQEVVDRVAPEVLARAVHSIWFEVIGEHGFPTFAVWLALTATGFWYSVRLTRVGRGRRDLAWAHDLGRMAQVSIVAYLVSGTFLSLCYWDYFWTLLVVLGAAHALATQAVEQGQRTAAAPGGVPGWRRREADAPPAMARAVDRGIVRS